jgi:hypothetical protein
VFHGRRLSDQSVRGAPPQGAEQTLHDRMLLVAELFGMALRQTADNGDRGQLWLGRQPASISAACGSSFDGIRTRFL